MLNITKLIVDSVFFLANPSKTTIYPAIRMSAPIHQPRLLDDLPPTRQPAPSGLSVSGLVAYARCPRQCFWGYVEPLPRRASSAARLGSLVHGWIERRASGQGALLLDDVPTGGDDRLAAMQAAFLASPYGKLRPLFVERPFTLEAAGAVVRGRVDAVYERDGRLEIVDFKTGRGPAAGDPSAGWQLDVYALAAVECWGHEPGRLRTAEVYLDRGEAVAAEVDEARLAAVRRRLAADLGGLAAGRFPTSVGAWCHRCDYRSACPEGRAAEG